MEEENKHDIGLPPKQLLRVVMTCLVLIAIALVIYFSNFNGGWGDREAFGQFGDFFGGLLNPLLSFLTIVLLIWSINVQLTELKLTRLEMENTRSELAQSAKAQTQSYELHLSDLKYNQIEKRIFSLYADFENKWNTPFFPKSGSGFQKVSLYHAFEESTDERDLNLRNVRNQAKNMEQNIVPDYNIKNVLKETANTVLMICELTADSYNFTLYHSVAVYGKIKAENLLDKMNGFGLITGEEYQHAKDILKLPGHLHPDVIDRD